MDDAFFEGSRILTRLDAVAEVDTLAVFVIGLVVPMSSNLQLWMGSGLGKFTGDDEQTEVETDIVAEGAFGGDADVRCGPVRSSGDRLLFLEVVCFRRCCWDSSVEFVGVSGC